jgi:transketolase
MRNSFADELTSLASADSRIVLLYGDIGNKLFDKFKDLHPNRYFNCGVAEASMVGIAAGLSKKKLIPFVYTINSFLYSKAFEQIKLDVCYANRPVVLVGTGSGLSYSNLGTTHHSIEDLGVLRQLPNLQVLAPSTLQELKLGMSFAISSCRPTYMRIGKKETFDPPILRNLSNNPDHFGPNLLRKCDNSQYVLITSGTISENVSDLCKKLNDAGTEIDLISFPQIAPINYQAVQKIFDYYKKIIVIEEHNEAGALISIFDAVARGTTNSSKLLFIGLPLRFYTGLGNLEEARETLQLSTKSLLKNVENLLRK